MPDNTIKNPVKVVDILLLVVGKQLAQKDNLLISTATSQFLTKFLLVAHTKNQKEGEQF